MTEQKRFVAGFLFSKDLKFVALIRKQRTASTPNCPAWQEGKLNGVGGKVEMSETSDQAMTREFGEETGAYIPGYCWNRYVMLEFSDSIIHCFCVRQGAVAGVTWDITSQTGEQVNWYPVNSFLDGFGLPHLENIPQLLSLALQYFAFCDIGKHK